MGDPRVERLGQVVDGFKEALQSANAPAEFSHFVGVMNGMLRIYERTAEAGIDFGTDTEPLVALPSQVKYLEQKLNELLTRIAGASIKLKTE